MIFSGFFVLLYIQPLARVAILEAETTLIDGKKTVVKELVKDELRPMQYHNIIDSNESAGSEPNVVVTGSDSNFGIISTRKWIRNSEAVIKTNTPELSMTDSGRKCIKKWNVSFLKVHKAGSTTIMNIFLRFAIQNNLNIVLPARSHGFGFNYLGYGKTVLRENIVPLPGNKSYNILCNHVVYNKKAFRSIMPEDTLYVGIIREPKSHFISASSYYGFFNTLEQYAKNHNTSLIGRILSEYLRNPSNYGFSTYFVHNRMSFDFGVPVDKFSDGNFVDKYIHELSEDYTLIMVMERFEESLVLMKRALCWDTKDILYVPLNARSQKSNVNLTESDVLNLQKWNSADFKLYDTFNKLFESLVDSEGDDFQKEVEHFKVTLSQVQIFCRKVTSKENKDTTEKYFEATSWSPGFSVNVKDCMLMTESELPMMSRLINQAWLRYNNWKSGQRKSSENIHN